MEWQSDSIVIPGDVTQIRFRFVSNNSTTNRGWLIDNVYINGVIDDDCDSLDNFLCKDHQTGNFWQSPDIMHEWYGISAQFAFDGLPDVAPGLTFGCYDDTIAPFAVECYPQLLDNSMDWTIGTEQVFYGWYELYLVNDWPGYYDSSDDDDLDIEISTDGTTFTELVDPYNLPWSGVSQLPVEDAMMNHDLTIRFRFTSDDVEDGNWIGTYINDMHFYGMKDTNAPETTAVMSGVFDDVYDYYTSEVAVQLTATDDISGVAAIYYELDGTQYTYDRPFIIEGDGEHTLCYWAVDNEGNTETKKCVAPFRIDETGPSVEITGPAPGIYLMGNKLLDSDKYVFLFGGFEVTATVDVDDAPLATVEFYFNDVLVGEDTTAPFKLRIAEKNSGSCTIKVVAIDVLGEDDEDTLEIDTYFKLF
jgi:hypothetical protein